MAEVVVMHMMYDGPYKQPQLVRYPAKPSDVLLRREGFTAESRYVRHL